MRILYDSRNTLYKKPFGCVVPEQECSISVHIPAYCQTETAFINIENDNGAYCDVPMKKTSVYGAYDVYTGVFSINDCGLYFYKFNIVTKGSTFDLYKQNVKDTNIGEGDKWQISCCPADFKTPDAFKGNVIYQIFPDRFYKSEKPKNPELLSHKLTPYHVHESMYEVPVYTPDEYGKILNNDFFGGDLEGIRQKLGYIKRLGVNTIYLNPIFMAYSNHRYDTCDYKRIDPLLGDEQDFKELCESAHKMHIKIILDGVFSHTGCDSIYFDKKNIFGNGAVSNPNSPYKQWYKFSEYPNKYESWWGIDTLPCVDELNSSYIDYIITGEDSVVKHWLRLGADGFRLDVADELPDEFIKILRDTVKQEKSDAIVIGEVWEDASNKISYSVRRKYFSDAELDSVMNYPFKNAVISFVKGEITPEKFEDEIMTVCENYPKQVLDCLMNSLSTHDTTRIITELGDADFTMTRDEKAYYRLEPDKYIVAVEREMLAVMLQFMLPGSASVYYGDEIAMQGFNDPFNREYFKWQDINMHMLEYYRFFGNLKRTHKALKDGDIKLETSDGILYLTRFTKNERITAVVNTSNRIINIKTPVIIAHNATVYEAGTFISHNGFAVFNG